MRKYVIWALVDPEKPIAQVLHVTGENVWTRPALFLFTWNGFKNGTHKNRPMSRWLAEWFSSLKERGLDPKVKRITRGAGEPVEIRAQKLAVIQALEADGFRVITSALVVRGAPVKTLKDLD